MSWSIKWNYILTFQSFIWSFNIQLEVSMIFITRGFTFTGFSKYYWYVSKNKSRRTWRCNISVIRGCHKNLNKIKDTDCIFIYDQLEANRPPLPKRRKNFNQWLIIEWLQLVKICSVAINNKLFYIHRYNESVLRFLIFMLTSGRILQKKSWWKNTILPLYVGSLWLCNSS